VATDWTSDAIAAFAATCRATLRDRAGRVSHLRIDPEVERDGPHDEGGALRRALRAADFRPAAPIQPNATRIIDLRADEDALWDGLRKKWRQYVNKARKGGIVVVDGEGERLPEFYRIYRETADRAGFLIRTEGAYRDVWEAFRPHGLARLLFAQTADGEPLATLLLVRAGPRVVEPYGGMTQAGGDSRANYLLKWEAIRTSKAQGATSYDLWGLATGGIAHFKTGFGGREVQYVGAWDLVLDPIGRQVYQGAQRARVLWARRRHGLRGRASASAFTGGEAGGSDAA
jgi:lipid II:glycine glycyltransferase (peptidoglycan interpeptide bridge formation enzyme)